MKLPKILLLAGLIGTPLAVAAIADNSHKLHFSRNPVFPKNRVSEMSKTENRTPTDSATKPGWSSWKLPEQLEGIEWGFSNMTLGLGLDMEHQCNEAAKGEEFQYWYRLSDMLNYTGNGTLEIGCWHDGRFLHTWTVSDARRRGWDWLKPVNCGEIPTIITESEAVDENQINREELSEGAIADAQKLLDTKECPECYLAGANLAKGELGGATLNNADLSRTNLAGANLSNANLAESYAGGAHFKSANLAGANLENAAFDRANLACVDLRNANLKETFFSEASLIRANLEGANLENARLGVVDLSNANLKGANLRGAYLDFANLQDAVIDDNTKIEPKWRLVWELVNQGGRGRNLRGVDLESANLAGVDLADADLSGANLNSTNLRNANLLGANLEGANLEFSDLCGATMPDGSENREGCD